MTNDTTVTCPKCGAEIPLNQPVSHRVREQLAGEFEQQRRELNRAIAAREAALATAQAGLEARQAGLQGYVERLLLAERPKLLREATQQVETKLGVQLRDAQTQLEEQRIKLKEAQDAELGLRRRQRELDEAKASLELDVARKLDAERGRIAETARQQAVEAERLKLADKEQLIKGLQDQIAALKQRAEQGSIQSQGETLEIELENSLRSVEFRQHIEGIVESFTGLEQQLVSEQRAFARQWKEREQQIRKALQHTIMLYGSVQGIAGRQAIAEIKTLELQTPAQPEGDSAVA